MVKRTRIAVLIVILLAVSLIVVITTATTATNTAVTTGNNGTLNLPRVAWEGGSTYWNQFPITKAAGWDNKNFFPLVIWFDSVSSNAEVRADKSYGINTYIGEPVSTDYNFFANNNVFVLTALSNTPSRHGGTRALSRR